MLKHTNKMILIPYSQYERLTNEINKDKVIVNEQKESKVALEKINTSEIVKPENEESNIENKQVNITNDINNNLSDSEILSHFSKKIQNKTKLLLDYIHQNTHITWTKKGEISIKGHQITNSHIIDLIKYIINPNKHFKPLGNEFFLDNLKNIPKSLLNNIHIKQPLEKQLQLHNEPPPGVPFSKKIRLDKTIEKNISSASNSDNNNSSWKQLWQQI